MEVVYDEDKFVEMALYIAGRLQDDCVGGATKLNTALFLAEFTNLRRHHRVISGCEFQKLAQGPTPRQFLPVRIRLTKSGEANLVIEDFLGRPHHRLVPTRFADLSVFSDDELKTIEDVLTQLAGMTGTQVSELSHQEPGWRLTEVGETIPFSTAFLDCQQVQTPISKQLSKSVAEHYGLEPRSSA
ncbi:MAG: SocA family protein [Acidimicrobiia bacterium]|nr:SocA family protein [Acidimicrobiia bacterium]MCY4434183.1 Panacea domain-containing protein [bacterium]